MNDEDGRTTTPDGLDKPDWMTEESLIELARHRDHEDETIAFIGRLAEQALTYQVASHTYEQVWRRDERKVARARALCGGPFSDGYRPYAVRLNEGVILTVELDVLRDALTAPGEEQWW